MKKTLLTLLLCTFFNYSCEKADPVIENEEELITTVIFKLTSQEGEITDFIYKDLDGDGGVSPTITSKPLKQNTSYSGQLLLMNEQNMTSVDISKEVETEGIDHQFFFSSTTPELKINYNDSDTNGKPIGLKSIVSTGKTSAGKLTIILKHKPDKSAAGVSEGTLLNAGGETDVQIDFDIVIR